MDFLHKIQLFLEEGYGAHTGIDVRHFVKAQNALKGSGKLLIEQEAETADLNIALLLDRDILAAWESWNSPARAQLSALDISVPMEEVSHFVYLSWNHTRGRNVTSLEMEIQSEVDRVFLAFHGELLLPEASALQLLNDLFHKPYTGADYELARLTAARFIRFLGDGNPAAWTETEFRQLREFFHSDLSRKIALSRDSGRKE